jgi:hypothetical protein
MNQESILQTIGDAYVGITNLTEEQSDHAARMARFAIEAVKVSAQ